MVYQDVTRNNNIPLAAKGLYAYLASFCGSSDECYPSIETILKETGIGRDTFYRHINVLVAVGVVEKKQIVTNQGRFGSTVYKLTHNVEINDFPNTKNEDTENPTATKPTTDVKDTNNNNNINNNNINNNNTKNININNINYKVIVDMYNNICVSFPRLTKLSEARKKAIKARLNTYSVEDFRRLFELAESSSFLKGQNDRNWSATFDWLIKDSNMAKVLDGNYTKGVQQKKDDSYSVYQEMYEKYLTPSVDGPFQ